MPIYEFTRDYTIFRANRYNRPLRPADDLIKLMTKYGFLPGCPLYTCHSPEPGLLDIIKGHHRFHVAQQIDCGVWYVIDDTPINLPDLEGGSRETWSQHDFAVHYAQHGENNYQILLDFMEAYHLPLGIAAALVSGQTASSNTSSRYIKEGRFRVGNMDHAYATVHLTEACRAQGIDFATTGPFVQAVSTALRVPDFSSEIFLKRLRKNPKHMQSRANRNDYLEEIEELYNYRATTNKLYVRHLALMEMQRRDKFNRARREAKTAIMRGK